MTNISDGFSNSFVSDKKLWGKVKKGYTHFAEKDIGIAKITPCFENKKSVVFTNLINGYGAGTTELHIIRTVSDLISPEYLLCFAKMDSFITGGVQTFSGDVGQQRVTKDYIENYLISLPPLNEQARILFALNKSYDMITKMDASKLNVINDITKAKSKILDLAIRGKLVPQDPNDEPASVLLERIRAEKEELIKQGKIKRDKKESVIFKGEDNSYYEKVGSNTICIDDEIPFDIPDNWCWSRLENIVQILDNERIPVSLSERKKRTFGKTNEQLYPYYGATGATGYIDSYLFDGDYLLLGEDGAPFLEKQTQKAYIIKGKSWVNNHAHILKPFISIDFLCAYLNSMDYLKYVHGTTRLKLTQLDMCRIIVPIPPKNEQEIISNRVNNIIDSLCCAKASLK